MIAAGVGLGSCFRFLSCAAVNSTTSLSATAHRLLDLSKASPETSPNVLRVTGDGAPLFLSCAEVYDAMPPPSSNAIHSFALAHHACDGATHVSIASATAAPNRRRRKILNFIAPPTA